MKTFKKERAKISELWFCSKVRNSRPNLAIQAFIQRDKLSFVIGIYSFNSVTGINHIDPIFPKMNYEEVKNLLTK